MTLSHLELGVQLLDACAKVRIGDAVILGACHCRGVVMGLDKRGRFKQARECLSSWSSEQGLIPCKEAGVDGQVWETQAALGNGRGGWMGGAW